MLLTIWTLAAFAVIVVLAVMAILFAVRSARRRHSSDAPAPPLLSPQRGA